MNFEPTVSVIVPVLNAEVTIGDCIDSLLALDYPSEKLELMVVDNASTDRTVDIVRGYRDRIRLLSENKRGVSSTRNRGMVSARGEIIAMTDADCSVDKEWLKHLVVPLANETIGIVGGKILAHVPCNAIEKFGEAIHDHRRAIEEYRPGYVITMNWAARRDLIKELGMFDETLLRGEDTDFSWRVLQRNYRFAYVPHAVVMHRNEKTLSGLLGEGYVHGYHGVRLHKKHERLLRQYGFERWHPSGYHEIISGFVNYMRGRASVTDLYSSTFNAGKKLGRLAGSVRWLYLDL